MQTLKYAKKELHADEKEQLKIMDPPVSITCSQYHYFILHRESLTVLSTINEKVVAYYEGVRTSFNIHFENSYRRNYVIQEKQMA